MSDAASVPELGEGPTPDPVLLASGDLARAALLEITPATSIGGPVGHVVEGEHVLSLLFACTLPGYPGWHWSATLARVDENTAPTVLEVELTPGEDALLAPGWVPWSQRMAENEAAERNAEADSAHEAEHDEDDLDQDALDEDLDDDDLDDDDLDDDDLDDDDLDDDDLDEDDIDGVDIDELAALDVDVDESDESEGQGDEDDTEGERQTIGKQARSEQPERDERE